MSRPVVFLAVALAVTGATAQAPIPVTGGGSPITVQPVQIGRPDDNGGAAAALRAREQDQARQPAVPQPSSPVPLSNCTAGGCWDSQGKLYNSTGDGSRFISPEGRQCQASGKFMQCN